MIGGVGAGQNYSVQRNSGQVAQVAAQQNKAPVTAVTKTATVERERLNPVEYQIPTAKEGVDPQEAAIRQRIGTPSMAQLQSELGGALGELSEAELEELKNQFEDIVEEEHPVECECCKNRRYKDGSDDGSVSYQTPTHISPETSGTKVMAHEQEHVVNEQLYAERDGREVMSQNVAIYKDVCPECGRSYTSGGKTTTVTGEKQTAEPVSENKISLSSSSVDKLMGLGAS